MAGVKGNGYLRALGFHSPIPSRTSYLFLAMGKAGGMAFIAVKSGKQATPDLIGSREFASGMRLSKR